MIQESFKVAVRLCCAFLRKPGDLRLVGTVNRRDRNSGNCFCSPRVSCADVAAANQSDANGHMLRKMSAAFLVFAKYYEAPSRIDHIVYRHEIHITFISKTVRETYLTKKRLAQREFRT